MDLNLKAIEKLFQECKTKCGVDGTECLTACYSQVGTGLEMADRRMANDLRKLEIMF